MVRLRRISMIRERGARCFVTPRTGFMLAALLAANSAVCAEDTMVPVGELFDTQRNQWQEIDANMSPEEYGEATARNQRIVTNALHDTVVSLGVPDQAIALTGAAVVLATGAPKVHLNKSKTMSLQLKDAVDRNRSVYLKIKFDWQ